MGGRIGAPDSLQIKIQLTVPDVFQFLIATMLMRLVLFIDGTVARCLVLESATANSMANLRSL
jgi:hypothetical protein